MVADNGNMPSKCPLHVPWSVCQPEAASRTRPCAEAFQSSSRRRRPRCCVEHPTHQPGSIKDGIEVPLPLSDVSELPTARR